MDNGGDSRLGWTKIQETYENVHLNLVRDLLFTAYAPSGMRESLLAQYPALPQQEVPKVFEGILREVPIK